jgi:NAD(P)-dependent dehydrogenase (short-subunit alcohol dehydrogenase family)
MEVRGTVALVTGAGSGIGAGIAEALVEAGARVVLADLDPGRAEAEAARIGGDCLALGLDVAVRSSWAEAKSVAEQRFGPVDILVNNAGIATPRMPLEDMPEALFAQVMAVNVTGVFNGVAAFAAGMKARGRGHVVNTASVNGLIPFGTFTTYSASKFAVVGLSEALAQELAPHGVGLSILYPGLTRSRMSLDPDTGASGGRPMTPALEAMMMDPIWLGRATVRAIEDGSLHIVTHPDHLPALEARLEVLRAAFGEPAQPGYGGGRTI